MSEAAAAVVRLAVASDLEALVALFAADDLGGHGDTTDPALRSTYAAALDRILANPADRLFVVELGGRVVGTGQLTLLDGLTKRGGRRGLVRAVQVEAGLRGRGIGAALIARLIEAARAEGAVAVELTSNGTRRDAHRFYERLGFVASHVGFKLKLAEA